MEESLVQNNRKPISRFALVVALGHRISELLTLLASRRRVAAPPRTLLATSAAPLLSNTGTICALLLQETVATHAPSCQQATSVTEALCGVPCQSGTMTN
eukprot:6463511-Amphidinium_carterae.2